MSDSYRESAESWADLLLDCRLRGMPPVLAIGDGTLGFWKAIAEVLPEDDRRRRRAAGSL
ncbi:hypothetical protein ACH4OT_35110 [Streptomyces murinus]|uniref:hypothetical protein n=1 Tax=Streptomyces murinus TaxID=33900 RepID=UPI0037B686E6